MTPRRFLELSKLALGGIRRTPLRVILTSLGVTIAIGALISMVGFALGLERQMETSLSKLQILNRIEVFPRKAEKSIALDEAMLAKISSLPGVAQAYPHLRISGIQVSRGDKSETAFAVGMPPELASLGFVDEFLSAGSFLGAEGGRQAVIGKKLAQELGFASSEEAVGQAIQLKVAGLTPEKGDKGESFVFKERQLEVTVAGVFDLPPMAMGFGGAAILLPLDVMRDLPGSGFDQAIEEMRQERGVAASRPSRRVIVHTKRASDVSNVERQIQELGLDTRSVLGQMKEMRTGFIFLDVLLGAVGSVALVVASLGIINTLLMSVLERYQEIGIYKATGASDGDVRILFLAEAGLVGLLGALGGLVLGRVVSFILNVVVNEYASSQGLDQQLAVFAFPFWLMAGAVLFAIVLSIASGVYPASRAARIDPIRALRRD
jgi:putative ABC transport system permease protein